MGLFDFFGKKRAEEEAAALEQQKEQQHIATVEEQKAAHEGLSWPKPFRINLMRTKDGEPAGIEDPISEERKEELGQMIYEPRINSSEVTDLATEELLFLLVTHEAYNRHAPLENYDQNHRVFYNELLNRIHEAEHLYILYDVSTGYPFLDGGYVCVYLDQDHATKAVELYKGQFRRLVVAKRPGEGAPAPENGPRPLPFFDYLYYLGMENIVVDNGWYKAFIKRGEISAPPSFGKDPSQVPPASPALVFAMTDFIEEMRWPVQYEKRQEVTKRKLERVMGLVPKATFLMPVQMADAPTGENGQTRKELRFPMIRNRAKTTGAEIRFIPLFTDLFEYSKKFGNVKDYRPVGFAYPNLLQFLAGADGFIINPNGQGIVLPKIVKPQQSPEGAAQGADANAVDETLKAQSQEPAEGVSEGMPAGMQRSAADADALTKDQDKAE